MRDLIVIGVLAVIAAPATAAAAVTLCVEVHAAPEEAGGLERLVLDELGRHPSHAVVAGGCAARLYVELFDAGGARYLTARAGRGVPARYTVKDGELGEAVTRALRLVLDSDPVYLAEDITRYSAAQRAAHSVLARGHTRLRLEVYEAAAFADGAAFAPGGALTISRGADHWQAFSRVYFGGLPGDAPTSGRALRIHSGGDAGVAYELDALSSWSFYVAAGAGAQLLRFEGRATPADPASLDARIDFGFTALVRAGVRLMRLYDFDCDLFVQAYLPVFVAGDLDSALPRAWAPSMVAGLGVGF